MSIVRQHWLRLGLHVGLFVGVTVFVAAIRSRFARYGAADPAAATTGNGGGNAANPLLNMDLEQLSHVDVKVRRWTWR